jgi:hypothetical protein
MVRTRVVLEKQPLFLFACIEDEADFRISIPVIQL